MPTCTHCGKTVTEIFGDFYGQVCCWECLRQEVDAENKVYERKEGLR